MNKAKEKNSRHGQNYILGLDFRWETVRRNWERVKIGILGEH